MKNVKRLSAIILALLACLSGMSSAQPQESKGERLPQVQEPAREKSDSIKKVRTASLPLNAMGGLILPKLELSGAKSLSPYAEETDGDFAKKKESLVGLLVYHTGCREGQGRKTMPAGVYVWSGETWLRVSQLAENAGQ